MKHLLRTSALLFGLLTAANAHAQTGVSDNRVSLPDGPGSLEGIGDDTAVTGNMGAMSYTLTMSVPPGFAGLTPGVALEYSSAGGPGIAGVGWSMSVPAIERLSMRGVPEYDLDDEFQADGQLVYVGGTSPRVYRSRFEGGFVRYSWYDAGEGGEGYWTAEYPDGRVGYFGAEEDGSLVSDSRVGGDAGTFRYHLVEMVDTFGHVMRYDYGRFGTTSLPTQIGYAFDDGVPYYTVAFTYEDREDLVVDATGGFVETLAHRLDAVEVFAGDDVVDGYNVSYEPYADSGGFSRVSRVDRYGSDGGLFPVSPSFTYSAGLGEICDGVSCDRPFVRSLGNIGVDISTGDPQLIDINGDSLPDIVDSTLTAEDHRIFLNTLEADGSHYFDDPYDSAVGSQDGFDFSNPRVQLLDVDGDGFTDAVNVATGQLLRNTGTGDWTAADSLSGVSLPDFDNPAILETLRFVDIDNDRRIDLLRASGSGGSHITELFRNTEDGYADFEDIEPLSIGFDSGTVEVNDINGDGLVDVAQVTTSGVRYRLSLGYGQWAPDSGFFEANFDDAGLEDSETADAELEDLNGDGFADLVLVRGSTIEIWINQSGESFESIGTITDSDVDAIGSASIPSNTDTTTVLFADVNGNGSSDIVWVTSTGDVTMLELFPVRPNLLATIDNGLGSVTTVTYGTSVEELARDVEAGEPWPYSLPFPNIVVTSLTVSDALTGITSTTRYAYHDGFYDGVEKMFRGYETVELEIVGDEFHESGAVVETYDVGVEDPYTAGPMVRSELYNAEGAPMQQVAYEYDDCEVEVDDDDALFDVRFWCTVGYETTLQEGVSEDQWQVERSEFAYDGYGNVIETDNLGTVSVGGSTNCGECFYGDGIFGEACGAGCLGDESYTSAVFIEPGTNTDGRWLVGVPSEEFAHADAARTEVVFHARHFYDGDAFEGLPLGRATRGYASRTQIQVDGEWQNADRNQIDDDGNVVVALADDGSVSGDGYRTLYEYDDLGLRITAVLSEVDAATTLRRDFEIEPTRGRIQSATDWYREGSTDAVVERRYAYDEFGRVEATALPGGDTLVAPTLEHVYHYEADHAWTESFLRTEVGGSDVHRTVGCIDGRGRVTHVIQEISAGVFEVRGRQVFGVNSAPIRQYNAYVTTTDDCTADVPEGIGYITMYSDVFGREIRSVETSDDGDVREIAVRFEPGASYSFSSNDLDSEHPDFDTPLVALSNGRGETYAVGRKLEAGDDYDWYRFGYDATGMLTHVTDPLGNQRVQTYDERGRILTVDDPDRGTLEYEYTEGGALIAETDPTGTVRYTYDGAGRLVETWVDGERDDTLVTILWDGSDECPESRCTFAANHVVGTRYQTPIGEMTDWSGYDVHGQMIWNRRQGDSFALERTWQYNQAGELLSQGFSGGAEVTFEYDNASRLTAIPGYVSGVDYDDRGLPSSMSYANGTSLMLIRDGFRRIETQVVDGPSSTLLDRRLAYDDDDRLMGVTDAFAGSGAWSASAAFAYDAYDRLVEATLDPANEFEEVISYRYDAIENLLERSSSLGDASPVHDGARTISDDLPHAVIQVADRAYDYDAAGRVIRFGDSNTNWSGFGWIASYADEAGDTIVEFGRAHGDPAVEVGADGSLAIFHGPDFELRDGVASVFPTAGDNTLARYEYTGLAVDLYGDPNADGETNSADAWLAYAAERGFTDALETPTRTANEILSAAAAQGLNAFGERTTWLHRDSLASLALVTDGDGEVIEELLYYPFGELRTGGEGDGEDRDFTDRRRLDDIGVVLFPLRDYEVASARWMQPDIAFATFGTDDIARPWETFAAYSYAMNNPVGGTDPSGANFEPSQHQAVLQIRDAWNVVQSQTSDLIETMSALNNAYTALAEIGRTGGIRRENFTVGALENFVTDNATGIAEVASIAEQAQAPAQSTFASALAPLTLSDTIQITGDFGSNISSLVAADDALENDLIGQIATDAGDAPPASSPDANSGAAQQNRRQNSTELVSTGIIASSLSGLMDSSGDRTVDASSAAASDNFFRSLHNNNRRRETSVAQPQQPVNNANAPAARNGVGNRIGNFFRSIKRRARRN